MGAATAGIGAAALSMAGCGDGGDGDGSGSLPRDKSGLVTFPTNTTTRAKVGGALKDVRLNDIPSMDPHVLGNAATIAHVSFVYPQLLRFEPAIYPDSGGAEDIVGELAESFELSGDKLQLTLKIRPGLKWDARPPTSGRTIDAEDVAWSFNRYARLSPLKGDLVYSSTNTESPIESVSTTDARTVVFKLAKPNSSILQLLAAYVILYILPRDFESSNFDSRGDVRGYGPYSIQEYRASSGITYKRNPDYHQKGKPYVETWEWPIVSEYAARLAQFKAGNIYTSVVTQEDVVQTKKDLSQTELRQGEAFTAGGPSWVGFGYAGDSPFKDQRVRQAMSMLLDREAFVDVFSNRQRFVDEGLELPVRFHTTLAAGWEGYWLDPTDTKSFGPNAKYLTYDVAEAKKLLSAAGFPNGFKTSMFFASAASGYGASYEREITAYAAMLREGANVEASLEVKDYAGDYFTNYYYGHAGGNQKSFNGMIYGREFGYPSAAVQMFSVQHARGPRFHGGSPDGNNPHLGDPKVNDLIDKIRVEFDVKKQYDLTHEMLRYWTGQSYMFPSPPHTALAYSLNWPILQNLGVYRAYTGNNSRTAAYANYWLDETKPPVSRPA